MAVNNPPSSPDARAVTLLSRRDLCCDQLTFRGRTYWSVKDPISLRSYQLRAEEYFILQLLDGRHSLNRIQERFEQEFAPRRLERSELQSFLARLHREGLLVADSWGQGSSLLARRGEIRRRARLSALVSVLAVRLPGVNPRGLLDWLHPRFRWLYSRWFFGGCVLLAVSALTLLTVHFDSFYSRLPDFQTFFTARNALGILAAMALVKVMHELAHAVTCRHFGAACREMGVMFLVFTPCLYCDVSDAWRLPNKWHRIAVSAAGIWAELCLASVCVFNWWFSQPGLLNSLCLNVVLVCSVGTLLINANPLLRFDGYYILSDVIEVPNLQQRAFKVAQGVISRWFFGQAFSGEDVSKEPQRVQLMMYGVLSMVYRGLVVVAILGLIAGVLRPCGLQAVAHVLTSLVVAGIVIPPIGVAVRLWASPPRRQQVSVSRFCFAGCTTIALLILVLSLPLPCHLSVPASIGPANACNVYVTVPGVVHEILVGEGDTVQAGEPLLGLRNLQFELDVSRLRAQRDEQRLNVEQLRQLEIDQPLAGEQLPSATAALEELDTQLTQKLRDQERLTLLAPCDGSILLPEREEQAVRSGELRRWTGTPLDERNLGSFLDVGTLVCRIANPRRLESVLIIDQSQINLVRAGQHVRIHTRQMSGQTIEGQIREISKINLETGTEQLIGLLPLTKKGTAAPRLADTFYQARVELHRPVPLLPAGTVAQARIVVDAQPLGSRIYRFLRLTFR